MKSTSRSCRVHDWACLRLETNSGCQNHTCACLLGAKQLSSWSCMIQVAQHMSFDVTNMEYYPTIFFNEFWLLRDYLVPINDTVTELPLHFTLSSMSYMKFTLFSQMEQAFSQQVCLLYQKLGRKVTNFAMFLWFVHTQTAVCSLGTI